VTPQVSVLPDDRASRKTRPAKTPGTAPQMGQPGSPSKGARYRPARAPTGLPASHEFPPCDHEGEDCPSRRAWMTVVVHGRAIAERAHIGMRGRESGSGDCGSAGGSGALSRRALSGRSDALVIDASGPWERVIEHPTLKHERPITGITRMSALIGKRKTQVAQLPNDWRVKSARRPLRAVTTG